MSAQIFSEIFSPELEMSSEDDRSLRKRTCESSRYRYGRIIRISSTDGRRRYCRNSHRLRSYRQGRFDADGINQWYRGNHRVAQTVTAATIRCINSTPGLEKVSVSVSSNPKRSLQTYHHNSQTLPGSVPNHSRHSPPSKRAPWHRQQSLQ